MAENEPYLDPELVKEVESLPSEDPFLTEYGGWGKEGDGGKIKFAEKWFPGENQWEGKTNITYRQAKALALLRNLTSVFEEVKDLEPFIDGLISNYEVYLTSVDGLAREQQTSILERAFGGPISDSETASSALASLIANPPEDDSND